MAEALDLERYHKAIRRKPAPSMTLKELSEAEHSRSHYRDPPPRQGEFTVVIDGVQMRGVITELRQEVEPPSIAYGMGRENRIMGATQGRVTYRAEVRLYPEVRPESISMDLNEIPISLRVARREF